MLSYRLTFLGLAMLWARGEVLAKPVAPPTTTPPILVLAEAPGRGNQVTLARVDAATGSTTALVPDLPLGVDRELVVDPATGRWAFSFHQLSNGDPLVVDGKPRSKPRDLPVLLVGDLDDERPTVVIGDPACSSRKRACFEVPLRFEANGTILLTRSEGPNWWMWNRRVLGKDRRPVAVADRALTRGGHSLRLGADGARGVYETSKGLFVTSVPAQSVRRVGRVKAGRVAIPAPLPKMSGLTLVGDQVLTFRVEDDRTQLVGYPTAGGAEVVHQTLPTGVTVWGSSLVVVPERASVVSLVKVGAKPSELVELALGGATPGTRTTGVALTRVLDVGGGGGRLVLGVRPRAPREATEVLVVVDLVTGRELHVIDTQLPSAQIYDAHFAAR